MQSAYTCHGSERPEDNRHRNARLRRLEETEHWAEDGEKSFRKIPLLHGKYAIVDKDRYDEISVFNWHCNNHGYAIRKMNGNGILMHRQIMDCPAGMQVDHKNGDRLDNRAINLRIADHHQQRGNTRKSDRGKTSRFKGVSFCETTGHWIAQGRQHGRTRHLGVFYTEEDAARSYDSWATYYFGEFAKLNFPATQSIREEIEGFLK